DKGGYTAVCAEVRKEAGGVRVARLVVTFECGAIVNPDGLKNQVEGAAIMGLGGALFEAIEFENGKILNPRLSAYRVPRFADVPSIEVVLVNRKDLPSAGAGETPIIGVAPAIANAVFNATGKRHRDLPMRPLA
ncbi:MAG: molybdopterin cofactor-binding domain-containing protein, partial [Bryobacteraceae bacterium]